MDDPVAYLREIELALISSSVIASYEVLRSWANTDDGYIRIRAILSNGDFLEAAEYFAIQSGFIHTIDYRYQWMDSERDKLRKRWDNTPDHPELASFPHHIHVGDEAVVLIGGPTSLCDLLPMLSAEVEG
jgi:hypothetical protein